MATPGSHQRRIAVTPASEWYIHACPTCGWTAHTPCAALMCPNDGTTPVRLSATVAATEAVGRLAGRIMKMRTQLRAVLDA